MRYGLAILCFLFLQGLWAQEVLFRGRLLEEGTDRSLAGLLVRAPGSDGDVTNDEGFFRLVLPPGTSVVHVEVPAGWAIAYPRNGRAPVPESSREHVEFLVKKVEDENQLLRSQIDRLETEAKLKDEQIDSLRRYVQARILELQNRLEQTGQMAKDSITELNQRVLELVAEQEQIYTQQNREEVFEEVSSGLVLFSDRLKDLRDWLVHVQDAFLSPQGAEQYRQVMTRYLEARSHLLETHQSLLQQVDLYWEKDLLTYQLEETYTLALKRIHQEQILPLEDGVNQRLRDFATGQSSRLSAQRKAKKQALQAVNELAIPIQELDEKIRKVNEQLRAES